MSQDKSKHRLSVSFGPVLKQAIANAAKKLEISESELVRMTMRHALNATEARDVGRDNNHPEAKARTA